MELLRLLEEEEREALELEHERKVKNVVVRFLITMVKNILNTLERS